MIVVVGGSLGGCEALQRILQRLPPTFPCPIAVVLHRHRDSQEILAPAVQRGCALPVCETEDKMTIAPGRVYICPPDYHLLFDDQTFALSTDEPVNFARPSVDVLFESAAEWQGADVVAVILSGMGADGAAGARRVVERGGTVLVQDPRTAEGTWMPNAAIEATATPHILSLEKIADRLLALGQSHPQPGPRS